jgi:tRNA uridine 5-carboxymethylaminomethyl modification enzyme
MVSEILVDANCVSGVRCLGGRVYRASAVVLTTGTFLRGLMHIGSDQFPGGRRDEPAAYELSDSLERIGLELKRLKTGTPARLDAATVDLGKLEIQHGDAEPMPFSFMTSPSYFRKKAGGQTPCWITWTNERIHRLIRDNLHRAPLYTGQIKSTGPRYCPSIETKIVRFADKQRHQVFLEPEDQAMTTIYCNGISTSLPRDVQDQMLRLLPGTEKARIVHYGYAIEYDYCPPIQLHSSLESKRIRGLFLAGQINGTSGYEEAAGQGIMAGINAARKLLGKEPIMLGRDQAYIGVLIDDLMTKGIDEPYRMFTSRAEYRLALRADNADRRLTPIGREVGLVSDERWAKFQKKFRDIERLRDYLSANRDGVVTLWDRLRQPNPDVSGLAQRLGERPEVRAMNLSPEVIEAAVIDAKYQGYLDKQERLAANLRRLDDKPIPTDMDYDGIEHLRAEAREKLTRFRPGTLGQASRISGITPADITVIQVHLKRSSKC